MLLVVSMVSMGGVAKVLDCGDAEEAGMSSAGRAGAPGFVLSHEFLRLRSHLLTGTFGPNIHRANRACALTNMPTMAATKPSPLRSRIISHPFCPPLLHPYYQHRRIMNPSPQPQPSPNPSIALLRPSINNLIHPPCIQSRHLSLI